MTHINGWIDGGIIAVYLVATMAAVAGVKLALEKKNLKGPAAERIKDDVFHGNALRLFG